MNQDELLMMTRHRPINSAGEICVNKYLRLSVSHLHQGIYIRGFFRLHWRPFAPIYKLAQHEQSLIPQAFVKHLNSLFRENIDQRHYVLMWRTEQTSSWVIYIFIQEGNSFYGSFALSCIYSSTLSKNFSLPMAKSWLFLIGTLAPWY